LYVRKTFIYLSIYIFFINFSLFPCFLSHCLLFLVTLFHIFMVESFRLRRIMHRAIWLLSHHEITLERELPVTSSFSRRAHFTLVFPFLSIVASSSRNAIIILSYDNGIISRSETPKKLEFRETKNSRSENSDKLI